MTITLNRAQKRKLAKPWKVRKHLTRLLREQAAEALVPSPKRERPRVHNGYDRPEAGPS